jgi:2,3-bisphosphoglycerate-dependent phosphoglycerate mutase
VSSGIILVRHAMPEVERGVASTLWRLGDSAKEDCVLLAHALPELLAPVIYTSGQPKTEGTAAVIALRRGLTVVTDPAFAEVDRPDEWDVDYRAVAVGYLSGSGRSGWEIPASVVRRFTVGVERALATAGAGDLVVINHGLALSLYLASRAPIDLVPFWQALTFPDAWRLDLDTSRVERLFFGGVAAET